jgi:anti-sigma regulatory factor (Ser/Thr protein kinase)
MKSAAGAAATEFDLLLPRIADSMRRPSLITRSAQAAHAGHAGHAGPAWAHEGAVSAASMDGTLSTGGAHDKDVTFALDTQLSAVGVARAVTASSLRRWHVTAGAYDVTTVVSELVTNALRHGAPLVAREWVILLRLIHHLDAVVCVVADPSTIAPMLREPDFVAETGRGLYVVQSYSCRWGWTLRPCGQGKIVWALI